MSARLGELFSSITYSPFIPRLRRDETTSPDYCIISTVQTDSINQRRFGGGVPWASSPAFLLVPKPNVTFDLSPPSAPVCEGESTADDILENPGLGAGEPEPDGTGLALADAIKDCICGAGSVMNPLSAAICAPFPSFFFFAFSVFPFESGWASKNSAAWGTALRANVRRKNQPEKKMLTLGFLRTTPYGPAPSSPAGAGTPSSCSKACLRWTSRAASPRP